MAVAHDAGSESHTGTIISTNESSYSWTHTPVGTPRGVLVFVFDGSGGSVNPSVTYGGASVPSVWPEVADTVGEAGSVYTFFLGSGVPSGAQTVTVNRTNSAVESYAIAATVTAAKDTEAYTAGLVALAQNQILVEQSVTDGSTGINSQRYAGLYSGSIAIDPGANSIVIANILVPGITPARSYHAVRETTPGQGARSVGFNSGGANDDVAAVHLAIREIITAKARIRPATIISAQAATLAGTGSTSP